MALTLRAAITATQTTFDVTGSDALTPGDLKTIGSEYVQIRTANQTTVNSGETAHYRVSAYRGALGSVEAAHAAGDALTTTVLGGGGVSVDNTVDAPFAATGIVAPGAIDEGGGVAALRGVYVDEDDPGAVGAHNLWLEGSGGGGFVQLHVRDVGDTDWIDVTPLFDTGPGTQTIVSPNEMNAVSIGDSALALEVDSRGDVAAIDLVARNDAQVFSNAIRLNEAGIYIGTAADSVVGLNGATPTGQSAAIADATDPATTMAQLNTLLAYLRLRGDIAT